MLNVEAAIVRYLSARLGVPVSTNVPDPRPASFVTVERTGGDASYGVIDRPQVTLDMWAATDYEASELAYEVDGLMHRVTSEPGFFRASRNSMYHSPDIESGTPRYRATWNLTTEKNKQ